MVWDVLIGGFFDAVAACLGFVFGLVPDVPSWVNDDGLSEVVEAVAGLDKWLPVTYVAQLAAGVVSAYLTAGMVGVGRSVVSSFTGGGGAS